MAIQPINFPLLGEEYTQALTRGLSRGQELAQNYMMFPQLLKQQQLANLLNQYKTQQEAKRAPYYGRLAGAEVAKAEAEPREMLARTGLYGSQSKRETLEAQKLNVLMPFIKQKEIVDLQKSQAIANLFKNIMGGNNGMGQAQTTSTQQPNITQSVNNPVQSTNINPNIQGKTPPSSPNNNYAQAELAAHIMGLPPSKIVDVNGTITAINPLVGNIPVARGLTEFQKELSKRDAEKVSEAESIATNAYNQLEPLNELQEIITSPTFEQMRQNSALGKLELAAFSINGTPEQKEMLGKFNTLTGEIIKAGANDFKGQFRMGEQALLSSMKPTEKDSLDVMKGKTQALIALATLKNERGKIVSQLMRNNPGMSITEAADKADKMVNGKQIREQIKKSFKNSNLGNVVKHNGKSHIKKGDQWYEVIE